MVAMVEQVQLPHIQVPALIMQAVVVAAHRLDQVELQALVVEQVARREADQLEQLTEAVAVAVVQVAPVGQVVQELLLLATQAPHKKHTVEQ
jgi:fructosamine-3-kinase